MSMLSFLLLRQLRGTELADTLEVGAINRPLQITVYCSRRVSSFLEEGKHFLAHDPVNQLGYFERVEVGV